MGLEELQKQGTSMQLFCTRMVWDQSGPMTAKGYEKAEWTQAWVTPSFQSPASLGSPLHMSSVLRHLKGNGCSFPCGRGPSLIFHHHIPLQSIHPCSPFCCFDFAAVRGLRPPALHVHPRPLKNPKPLLPPLQIPPHRPGASPGAAPPPLHLRQAPEVLGDLPGRVHPGALAAEWEWGAPSGEGRVERHSIMGDHGYGGCGGGPGKPVFVKDQRLLPRGLKVPVVPPPFKSTVGIGLHRSFNILPLTLGVPPPGPAAHPNRSGAAEGSAKAARRLMGSWSHGLAAGRSGFDGKNKTDWKTSYTSSHRSGCLMDTP